MIVWWMHHFEKSWFAAIDNAFDWLNHHTAGLQDAQAAKWRAENWSQLIPDVTSWKYYIRKAMQHSIATDKAEELKHRWHFDFVDKLIDKGLEVEHSEILVAGLYEDGLPARHLFGCPLCNTTFSSKAAWSVHAFRKHGRKAPERFAVTGSICVPCHKEFHTTQRLLRHLKYNQCCADAMLEIEKENENVLPGQGNQQVDVDRTFPLPVLKLTGPPPPPVDTQRVCRQTFSETLLHELIACVNLSDHQDSETCVSSCIEVIKSSTDCSDEVLYTLEVFVEHYQDSEMITIAELGCADFGRRVSDSLKELVTFEFLFPEQRHEATPAVLRGATFRAVQQQVDTRRKWNPNFTLLRMRSRTLIVAHLFSGHRREGDLTGFLEGLPAPSGANLVVIPIDIIFDNLRCDLARRETQTRWKAIARIGCLIGFVAGPPCETFSVARVQGGRAGETSGDGGPRQIRSSKYPYGLPCMTEDERRHVHLGNGLLWFTYDLCAELLAYPEAFFVVEHPSPPADAHDKDFPSSWHTGACRLLASHPQVTELDLWQGLFGAKSPKPTRFLCKGVPSLEGHLKAHGTMKMPPPLKLRKTDGVYSTAELKAYPALLCYALSQAIRDSLTLFASTSQPCVLTDAPTEEWIEAIRRNANTVVAMGMDRAGACDL